MLYSSQGITDCNWHASQGRGAMHGRGGGGEGASKDVQVEVCRRWIQILTLLKKKVHFVPEFATLFKTRDLLVYDSGSFQFTQRRRLRGNTLFPFSPFSPPPLSYFTPAQSTAQKSKATYSSIQQYVWKINPLPPFLLMRGPTMSTTRIGCQATT